MRVTWDTQCEKEKALFIAKHLGLPCCSREEFKHTTGNLSELRVTAKRVQYVMCDEQGEHALFAEFTTGPLFYRVKKGVTKNDNLVKACGLNKTQSQTRLLDVTAGLGKDAFILASFGAKVELIERSPIMFTLLQDGLARAKHNTEIANIITQNMHLRLGEAITVLKDLSIENYPDVIYMDPMFDRNAQKALNKIEMRMIHDIVGEDLDAEQILQHAMTRARKRVVVKRMRQAEILTGPEPSFIVKGKSCRYDIYLTHLKLE